MHAVRAAVRSAHPSLRYHATRCRRLLCGVTPSRLMWALGAARSSCERPLELPRLSGTSLGFFSETGMRDTRSVGQCLHALQHDASPLTRWLVVPGCRQISSYDEPSTGPILVTQRQNGTKG